jgi:hypothetical protein
MSAADPRARAAAACGRTVDDFDDALTLAQVRLRLVARGEDEAAALLLLVEAHLSGEARDERGELASAPASRGILRRALGSGS